MEQKKNKKYSSAALDQALTAITNGMSIRKASQTFQIPRTTLSDKIHGKYAVHCKTGAPSVLSDEEEQILVSWILNEQKRMFPVTKDQLYDSVQNLMVELNRPNPFPNNRPQKKWYHAFLHRHPELSERTTQKLSKRRGQVTEVQIRNWFQEITTYLENNDLLTIFENPTRIFNCDESAFLLSPRGDKVLAKKGDRTVYSFDPNDEKECLTALLMCSAAGDLPPPLVVYSYKRIPKIVASKFPEGWSIGRSDNGWMTQESFFEYITNIFYPWLIKNNIEFPIALFVDGHTSHMNLQLSRFCSEHKIILISLFPNSTHILQPLDVAVFRALKSVWKKTTQKWRADHLGQKLNREDFAPLLKTALDDVKNLPSCIQNGFRTCGLYPLSPNNIKYEKFFKPNVVEQSIPTTITSDANIVLSVTEKKKFLAYFEESNMTKVNAFKNSGPVWNGDVIDTNLFYWWKKMNNDIYEETEVAYNGDSFAEPKEQIPSEHLEDFSNVTILEVNPNDQIAGNTDDVILVEDNFFESLELTPGGLDVTEGQIDLDLFLGDKLPELDGQGAENILMISTKIKNNNETRAQLKNLNEDDVEDTTEKHKNELTKEAGSDQKSVEDAEDKKINTPTGKKDNVREAIENNLKTPTKEAHTELHSSDKTQSKESNLTKSVKKSSNVPTPFKKYLLWEESKVEKPQQKNLKEKIPAVVSSEDWQMYQQSKEEKKIKELEEKENRKQKKIEKMKEKENKSENKRLKPEKNSGDGKLRKTDEAQEKSKHKNINKQIIEEMHLQAKSKNESKNMSQEDIQEKNNKGKGTVKKNDYVIVEYENKLYPGMVIEVAKDKKYKIKCMTKIGLAWKWPDKEDILIYSREEIKYKIKEPISINSRGYYRIEDFPQED